MLTDKGFLRVAKDSLTLACRGQPCMIFDLIPFKWAFLPSIFSFETSMILWSSHKKNRSCLRNGQSLSLVLVILFIAVSGTSPRVPMGHGRL